MSTIRLLLCSIILMFSDPAFSNTRFFDSSFEEARTKAQSEGKMLILDFYADWCAPCKFMESTTFQDPQVSDLLNQKFVPLKINIDDFDGYALKEHFDVKVLPTFIIFSSDGKVKERVEETLSPIGMLQLLEKNLASHQPIIRPANVSPKESLAKSNLELIQSHMITYKVQLGVYSSYENTMKFYKEIQAILDEPVIILHDFKGGKVIYRILIGNFNSTKEAHYYITHIKSEHGVQGHIFL